MENDDVYNLIDKSIRLSTLFSFASQKDVRRNYFINNGYFQILDIQVEKEKEDLLRLTLSDTYEYYDKFFIKRNEDNKNFLNINAVVEIERFTLVKGSDGEISFFITDITSADNTVKQRLDSPQYFKTAEKKEKTQRLENVPNSKQSSEKIVPRSSEKALSIKINLNNSSSKKSLASSRTESSIISSRKNDNSITFDEELNKDRPYTFTIFSGSKKKVNSENKENNENYRNTEKYSKERSFNNIVSFENNIEPFNNRESFNNIGNFNSIESNKNRLSFNNIESFNNNIESFQVKIENYDNNESFSNKIENFDDNIETRCLSASHIRPKISIDSKKKSYLPISLLSGLNARFCIKIRLQDWKLTKYKKYVLNVIDEDTTSASIMIKEDHLKDYLPIIRDFKTYYISGNYRFGRANPQKVIIVVESNLKIEEAEADDDLPLSKNMKVTLEQIESLYVQGITKCDMFLFVLSVNRIEEVYDEFKYATVKVSDSTDYCIDLIISKLQFENKNIRPGNVLFVTDVIIHFMKGYYLTTTLKSIIDIDLDIPETYELKRQNPISKIYTEHSIAFSKHKSLIKTILITDLLKRGSEKVQFQKFDNLFIRAKINTIVHKSENVYRKCSVCKKSTKQEDNQNRFMCENRHVIQNPEYSYCLKLTLLDTSGKVEVVAYSDIAERLLGMNANDYIDAVNDNENKYDVLNKACAEIQFKDFYFLIRLGVKIDKQNNKHVELNLINFEEFDSCLFTQNLVEILYKKLNIIRHE
jgi:hypothetical protein